MVAVRLKRKPRAPLGASLIVLSSFFYASYGIWTKLIGSFLGGYTASAIRSVLVLAMVLPMGLAARQFGNFKLARNWPYLVGMVFSSLFIWGPYYFAILRSGLTVAAPINYAAQVVGMFAFGWLLGRERFTRDKWWSTGLSFAGLYLVFSPSLANVGIGVLVAAFGSGLAMALTSVLVKHVPYNVTQSTLSLWIASTIANTIMALALHESAPKFGWHVAWVYLVLFAIASVVASLAFIRGLQLIEAGAAGILGLLELVFGVLFGVALFGEHIGSTALAGVALIIAAAAIPYIKDYNAQKGRLEGT